MKCKYCNHEELFVALYLDDVEYYVFVCLECGMVDRIEEV